MFGNVKIIKQHDARDCGAACLTMIGLFYKYEMSIAAARKLTKTDRNGTNIYGIVDGAKNIGLFAEALSGTSEEFLDCIKKNEIKFPIIAHIISDNEMYHFVVVYAYENDKFVIGDPAKGKVLMNSKQFFEQWTGNLITFDKTEKFCERKIVKKGLSKYLYLLKGQWKKITGILILSIAAAVIGIIGAFVFEVVMDNFADSNGYKHEHTEDASTEGNFSEDNYGNTAKGFNIIYRLLNAISQKTSISSINKIFICVIILYILKAVLEYLRGYFVILISKKIDIGLTMSYYNHVVEMPMNDVVTRQTGEYLSRFSDAEAVRTGISTVTVVLVFDSMMAIGGGIILFLLNDMLFFISLIMVLIYIFIFFLYKNKIDKSNRRVMEKNAEVQSYFKESIDGIETIKSYSAEKIIQKKATKKFTNLVDSIVKNNVFCMSQDVITDSVELIGTLIILWVGFSLVISGQLRIGVLITYYALISYFTGPMKNLIQLQPTIQKAFVAADRLNDILEIESENKYEHTNEMQSINKLELKNICFRYGNRELILNNINLTIEKGQKIALVGESGCGKTTLAKLLLGLYQVEKGNIVVNGNLQSLEDLISLREKIIYVSQESYLFSDTIRNNLLLGKSDITDNKMQQICSACKIDDFIRELPSGYDTPIDENGNNLSEGQKQRLLIARALLREPEVLILDEATSNLDAITEKIIQDVIFSTDITCIIINHHLNIVQECDCIYVIENGEIIESGKHDDLLNNNEKYSELWNK